MSVKTDFSPEKTKQIIRERGLKIKWLADRCDKSEDWLSSILNGHRKPSVGLVRLMAYVLEVTEDALTKGVGAPRKKAS